MAIIKEPKLYKFAISHNGTSNVREFFLSYKKKFGKSLTVKRYLYLPHDILTNDETNKKISPIYNYKKIETKMLLIEGGKDNYEVGTISKLYEKMKKNNQDVILDYYENEGHNFINKKNIFDKWMNISKFIKNSC